MAEWWYALKLILSHGQVQQNPTILMFVLILLTLVILEAVCLPAARKNLHTLHLVTLKYFALLSLSFFSPLVCLFSKYSLALSCFQANVHGFIKSLHT